MSSDLDIPSSVLAALRGGVGEEPPLRLTVPDLIARGRRARRGRQLRHAAGSLATVSLVGGVAATSVAVLHSSPGTGGGGRSAAQPSRSASGSPTPQSSAEPAVPPPATEPPARATARLDRALDAALRLPPGGRRVRVTGSPDGRAGAFYASQGGYKSVLDIVDPAGAGNLFIEVDGTRRASCRTAGTETTCTADSLPAYQCPAPQPNLSCTIFADGTMVTVTRQSEAHGVIRWTVSEARPDGNSVLATALNYGANSVPQVKNPPDPVAQRPTPPLTIAQLTALVHDPRLAYYPRN
ncbi:MAG TPA: hypothetical protein VMU51_37390 [Mycobacteriales bacterium]|nr:hypothetical protein [Mycobacteriales bacterium]